jgi:hypothetical protein
MTTAIRQMMEQLEQRRVRRDALADTEAWLAIEGLNITEQDRPLFLQYVEGTLSSEAVLEALTERYRVR